MADNPFVLFVLSIIWIPSFLGLAYLWTTYWSLRQIEGTWLLQMLCITSTPVTLAMIYVSWATFSRVAGTPLPSEVTMAAGFLILFGLAWIVPYKALRVYLTTHGRAPQPEIPVINGKGNGHGD